MRAIVQHGYGAPADVLELAEIDPPVAADDEVLIRVRAASMHADVWHVVRGLPYVLRLIGRAPLRPRQRVPGIDCSGVVEAIGRHVTRFRPGDEVFGETIAGYQWQNGGAFAELAAAPEATIAHKPANVGFFEAASVPTAGIIAEQNLHVAGPIQPGMQVLINGAAGGVGAIALQIAKAEGAVVTAVDDTGKLPMLRSLGADHVIDYTEQDFTTGEARYDLVFDIPGNQPFAAIRRVVAPGGHYVLIGHDGYGSAQNAWLGSLPAMAGLTARSFFSEKLAGPGRSMPDKAASLAVLSDLLKTGSLTPAIDRVYPLEAVVDAIEYLASGAVQGKVVIAVAGV